MTATVLLEELRQIGATVTVVEGTRLRIEVPKGRVTPELRQSLSRHQTELLALLCSTLPAHEPHRLTIPDCIERLTQMLTEMRAEYLPGALSLLNSDADLHRALMRPRHASMSWPRYRAGRRRSSFVRRWRTMRPSGGS